MRCVKFLAPIVLLRASKQPTVLLLFATGLVPLPTNAQNAALTSFSTISRKFWQPRRYQTKHARQTVICLSPRTSLSTCHKTSIHPLQACRRDLQVDHSACGVFCVGFPTCILSSRSISDAIAKKLPRNRDSSKHSCVPASVSFYRHTLLQISVLRLSGSVSQGSRKKYSSPRVIKLFWKYFFLPPSR